MDRIEVDSILPVPLEERGIDDNPPPSYDAAVKKNNYFPEVLMHQKNKTSPGIMRKRKRTSRSELPFLKLVKYIILFLK